MPSLKANLIISFVIFVILTSCFKLFKTSSFKNVPPKLHYQNKKLPFLPNKDKINSSTTTYIPITTKRPILISTNITCSTSFENSRITILNGGEPHTVGDTLHAQVEMYDFTNRRKLYGGDFLLARIFSPRLGAASSGVVTDLGNGVYDVRFTLFWPGDSSLAFTLVHASEAVSVLDRVRETIPDKVTFLGTFVSGKSSEVTQCHTFLKTTKQVCDYTDTHLNESWKCEKPSELPCSALLTIKSYNKYQNVFNEEESKFFTSDRIWVSKQLTYTVRVAPANDLQVIDLHKPGKHQPKKAVNKSYNVTWQWFCHSYPFIASADTYPEDLKYVANRIDNITGGSDTVLGICLGAHYTPFPLHVFEKRMCNIKAAVEKLLIRSPETKVIVKLANTRENYGVGILNNWGTFRINQILLEVFKNMNVAFVDAWDMTAVLNSAQVHPNLSIVKNQVNAFLSFIC
uniref:NXPE family member 4-like isoform X2 n=1 Tax=Petromyzon marinus TaxID=7757 RepID=A0AAJ7THZ9_PETMA|nr:NXPE family member 4-like isoform X2 [Petromyzon marinus]